MCRDNGVAEQVFRSLEPLDARAYNTIIKGMAKFYQVSDPPSLAGPGRLQVDRLMAAAEFSYDFCPLCVVGCKVTKIRDATKLRIYYN